MITVLTHADREAHGKLLAQMFQARAAVFHARLGWRVEIVDGQEIDRYDREAEPVYLLSVDDEGGVRGSLRLIPTTGDTMLKTAFASLFEEDVSFESPTAWECTRFCVHPIADPAKPSAFQNVSAELLIGLCRLAIASGIEQIVGLYDDRMTRIYSRIGWSPAILTSAVNERERLHVGIWDVSSTAIAVMEEKRAAHQGSARAA